MLSPGYPYHARARGAPRNDRTEFTQDTLPHSRGAISRPGDAFGPCRLGK